MSRVFLKILLLYFGLNFKGIGGVLESLDEIHTFIFLLMTSLIQIVQNSIGTYKWVKEK